MQGGVRVEDADQRHVRVVESLGHHLRADENPCVQSLEDGELTLVAPFPAGGVSVHAHALKSGERSVQLRLHALRPCSEGLEVGTSAPRAAGRHRMPGRAVMADQVVRGLMVGERGGAGFAGGHIATFTA